MSKVEEVDRTLSEEEASPINADEQPYVDMSLQGLTEAQRGKITKYDHLFVIRGYQTYDPRMEETVKAMKMIADWRDKVGAENFLKEKLEGSEAFHEMWPEAIYGNDKYGHCVLGMQVGKINTDGLCDMDEEAMLALQGQKMTAITQHKVDACETSGNQRYKHTIIVDLKGTGMSLLGGKKRGVIQRVFGVGGDYFPESVWKIYVVNTPFVFRACWAIIRPWIHPVTQAKVNIFGSVKEALKQMEKEGITPDQLPEWCGGTNPGVKVSEVLDGYIAKGGVAVVTASVADASLEDE